MQIIPIKVSQSRWHRGTPNTCRPDSKSRVYSCVQTGNKLRMTWALNDTVILVLGGKDTDSQYHFIGSPVRRMKHFASMSHSWNRILQSFREEQKLILAPDGLKKREASNHLHLCQRVRCLNIRLIGWSLTWDIFQLILMMSLVSILVGLMILGVVFTGARRFL